MCDVKNLRKLLFLFLVSATLFACTTNDVISNLEEIDDKEYFEIPDLAFGEYLLYNTIRTDDYKLPGNLLLKKDGKIFLNKKVATEVTTLYLVKDTRRMEALATAGVATANQKIVSLDGIQFFTNVEDIKLTSNDITSKLDLSMLTKLTILEMNANYVNELIVPASLERLRYAASTSADAPENRWLTAIDLSANSEINHIHLPNHHLTADGFKLPTECSKLTYIDVSGNTDAPFIVSADLFNQLETKNGVAIKEPDIDPSENLFKLNDDAFADYLKYNSTLAADDANKLPDGIVVEHNGSKMLDKTLAANVTTLYLVKDTKRMETLAAAGVTTANQKIVDLDGIQHFTSVVEIKLTSNDVVGKLDLSMLTKLEVLEMNSNYVNELIVPASLTRLRYAASKSAPENGWLTTIDVSANSNLDHIHLPNHKITADGLKLPTDFSKLTYIDLSGNPDAPFTIPADLFNQLETKKGVEAAAESNLFLIADAAFADYLKHNSTLAADDANKLPDGIIVEQDGKMMLDKTLAANVTNLYLVKDSKRVEALTAAGVATAAQKIVNLSGIQFFTNVEEIKLTSNDVVGKLDLSMLTKLKTLEMNSNYVNELIVPASITRLRYAASTSSSAPDNRWLTAIDLSKNSNLDHVHLPNHKITTEGLKLPTDYSKLTYIDLSGNTGAPFAIPAALFNQLETKKGVVSQ